MLFTQLSCLCYCKDTKLKAIHNGADLRGADLYVVYATAKILNWKQFTTCIQNSVPVPRCLCYCKDTKLKAIHNYSAPPQTFQPVVYATAKILNWKQFTTKMIIW